MAKIKRTVLGALVIFLLILKTVVKNVSRINLWRTKNVTQSLKRGFHLFIYVNLLGRF